MLICFCLQLLGLFVGVAFQDHGFGHPTWGWAFGFVVLLGRFVWYLYLVLIGVCCNIVLGVCLLTCCFVLILYFALDYL